MRKLDVYSNDTKAGTLTETVPGRGYTFVYCPEYLASELPPISVRMPKRTEPYESEELFPVFANAIPEGGNRRIVCRDLKIDETDLFGILAAFANQDFIGAMNVRTPSE